MTREQEIIEASQLYAKPFQKPFMDGAMWADEHPKKIEISMLDIEKAAEECINKDWREQQERLWNMIEKHQLYGFIQKACNYLKEHSYDVETEDNGIVGWISDEFIEDFKKAMRE